MLPNKLKHTYHQVIFNLINRVNAWITNLLPGISYLCSVYTDFCAVTKQTESKLSNDYTRTATLSYQFTNCFSRIPLYVCDCSHIFSRYVWLTLCSSKTIDLCLYLSRLYIPSWWRNVLDQQYIIRCVGITIRYVPVVKMVRPAASLTAYAKSANPRVRCRIFGHIHIKLSARKRLASSWWTGGGDNAILENRL